MKTLRCERRKMRHKRVRAKMFGSKEKPRLFVFRSAKHIYAQLIDDDGGKVLASASDVKLRGKKNKVSQAKEVGQFIAKAAIDLKVDKVVFDRGGYKYHGRIKALAEGAREGGLKF